MKTHDHGGFRGLVVLISQHQWKHSTAHCQHFFNYIRSMYVNLSTVIGITLSIILIGFFAGIQIAFVNVNRLTIELKKKQGKSSSILLSRLISAPTKFLGTTLIGFNICLVIYGLLVSEMLSYSWHWLIEHAHIPAAYINLLRLVFETLASTAIILVVGEFIPRAIWRSKSELLLNPVISKVVNFFYQLFHPVAAFFISLSVWVLKYLFNVRVDETKTLSAVQTWNIFFTRTMNRVKNHQKI